MQGNTREKRPPRPKWTEEQIKALKEMRERGMSAAEIVKSGLLPQSLNAIQKKLGRMDLVSHNKITKFNARQRDELRHFLRQNWEGRTPQDLSELWNQTHPAEKVAKRRVISYLMQLGLKIHYGEVQSMNKARERENKIRAAAKSPNEFMEMVRASRARVMKRRLELGRDIWTGMPLPVDILNEKL